MLGQKIFSRSKGFNEMISSDSTLLSSAAGQSESKSSSSSKKRSRKKASSKVSTEDRIGVLDKDDEKLVLQIMFYFF